MRWNWGTALVVFFIFFVSMLVFVLYQSTKVDNALVMDNYYEEDLKYQEHFQKEKNTSLLPEKVRVSYNKDSGELNLHFPLAAAQEITGDIWLYRASDKRKDEKHSIQLVRDSIWTKQIGKLGSGKWKVKIDWNMGSTPYYQEEDIIL